MGTWNVSEMHVILTLSYFHCLKTRIFLKSVTTQLGLSSRRELHIERKFNKFQKKEFFPTLANVSEMHVILTLSNNFLKILRIFAVHQFSKVRDVSGETHIFGASAPPYSIRRGTRIIVVGGRGVQNSAQGALKRTLKRTKERA